MIAAAAARRSARDESTEIGRALVVVDDALEASGLSAQAYCRQYDLAEPIDWRTAALGLVDELRTLLDAAARHGSGGR